NPLVGEGDGSGATPISVQLNAGTYFVQVGAATDSSSVYSLNVTGTVGDLGGTSTGTAYNMGVIGGEVRLSDWVGSGDTVDFYRFILAASGNVALFLNGLMADADLYLTNATGSVLAYSVLGGDEDETIIRGLAAGTYYARVNQFAGDTSYQLGLMLTSGDQAGNGTTSSPSLNLGELLGFESVNDWVGTGDTRDAYQFSLSSSSYVNIELSGLSADVDVLLSNGSTTITSSLRGVASDEVTLELSAGTYSVVVQQVAGESNYTLNLSSVSVDNSITGNDNSTTAENLGAITSVNVLYGWVGDGAAFDEDWYSFSVNANSMVGFYLSSMTGDADLAVYNQDGTLAYFSGNWGNDSEEISVSALAAGTYYVQVDQVAGDSAYELWYYAFNAETVANNATTAAQAIGSFLGVEEVSGWVGSVDTTDIYSIVATATSYLSLYLNELTADADLQLLSSTGATLNTSTQMGTMADAINTTVSTGTYYVRVYQYSGDTSYRLQISGALATADSNNATLGVQSLGVLAGQQQLYGWVGVGDSVDFYRFALTGTSNVDLRLWGMASDADMYLLNQVGSVLSSSLLDNAQDETISRTLSAGTYYVRVSQYSGSTAYGLTLSSSTGNELDNNNATTNAQQLGVVDGRIIADGWIGNSDGIDTYSFALSENTNLIIAMSGLAADADMQLLDSSGATIGSSFNGGTSDETINQALTAGIYYLQVYRYNGNTNYHLELSAVDSTVIDGNNATDQATSLGILAGVRETDGWVGSGDDQDYYSFVLDNASNNVGLLLSGLSADADLRLLNATGATLATSAYAGNQVEAISLAGQSAGTYFVQVAQYSGGTNYNLRLSSQGVVTTPRNATTMAQNVGTLTGNAFLNGWFDGTSSNNQSFHRFSLTATSNVNVVLSGLAADADLQLLGATGSTLLVSTRGGTQSEMLSSVLGIGTYFVRVVRFSGESAYNLQLNASAFTDTAGESASQSRDIGTLSSYQAFTNWVGSTDTVDFFRFSLSAAGNVNLLMSNLSADANMVLFNSTGSVILDQSMLGGTSDESIHQANLAVGTYYVAVSQFSGDTGYTLVMTNTSTVDGDNESTTGPVSLGRLSGTVTVNGWVGSGDASDYMSFSLRTTSNVVLNLTNLAENADLELLSSTGSIISFSRQSGLQNDNIVAGSLVSGTYFVVVRQDYGNTNYTLNLSASATSFVGPDNNNTTSAATNLGTLISSQDVFGWVGNGDANDYYKMVLASVGNLGIQLQDLSADADLYLRGANGSVLARSTNSGSREESLNRRLSAGTYYLQVSQYQGNTTYSLGLSLTGTSDGAGNASSLAQNIGNLIGQQVLSNWVGNGESNPTGVVNPDSLDYYRFALTATSMFNLALTGLTSDANVELLNAATSVTVYAGFNGGDSEEYYGALLGPGSYFVRVVQSNGDTNYELQMSTTVNEDTQEDNATTGAENFGVLNASREVAGWVGETDTSDYYKFVLSGTSNVTVLVNGIIADIDLVLFDVNRNEIDGSWLGGTSSELVSRELNKGTYFIQVAQYMGDTNYNLSLSVSSTGLVDVGNTTGAAESLGTLTAIREVDGWLVTGDEDVFSFNVTGSSNVNIVLDGMIGNADLELMSAVGSVITDSKQWGDASESILRQLAAGTYYVRIFHGDSDTENQTETGYTLQVSAQSSTADANNGTTQAQSIGALAGSQTYYGWVGSTDVNDYYRFTLGATSFVNILLDDLSANADVQLLSGSGSILAFPGLADTASETLSQQLAAGTYFVRVLQNVGDTTYSLTLSAASQNAVGSGTVSDDTSDDATSLGSINSGQEVAGWVGNSDTVDYFRFVMPAAGQVAVSLTGLAADADLEVLDGNGTDVLSLSSNGGNSEEEISLDLEDGTYFIRVTQYMGDTNYNLRLSGSLADNSEDVDSAISLGSLSGIQYLQGWVGEGDDSDYYSFSLTSDSTFSLYMSGMTGDADVYVLNSNNSVVASSTLGGSLDETVGGTLVAGTYYIRVEQFSGETNYNLQISGVATNDNAGNALTQAANLGQLTGGQGVAGWVSGGDSLDIYRFSLGGTSFVSLDLNGLSADADLRLLSSAGSTIAVSALGSTQNEFLSQRLAGGTYYVQVARVWGETAYNLNLSAVNAVVTDPAGNSASQAQNIGSLAAQQVYNNWVGTADSEDWFSFNISALTNVGISLSGMASDADLALYNASGSSVMALSALGGSADENIFQQLAAGSYLVQVYQYSGDTGYTLSLTGSAAAATDQAGQSTATALNLGQINGVLNVNGWVGDTDNSDFYRFELGQAANFYADLTGLVGDVDLELRGADGVLIQGSWLGGTQNENISYLLAAGTYYLVADQFYGNTNYNLTLSANATGSNENSDDTRSNANDLGVLTNNLNDFGWVGGGDSVDFYRFSLGASSNVSVVLADMVADANLQLFNSTGSILLGSSSLGGNQVDQVNTSLAAGTYLVAVNRAMGDTGYSLNIIGAVTNDPAGNTLTLAQNLGALSGNSSYYNWVGSSDTVDLYRFSLASESIFNLNLTGLVADADVAILNSTGSVVLYSSAQGGSSDENIMQTLSAGSY
ncbi:MAG: hypothetical protein G8345_15875, partial [Magnetococcales bacterium]|nr:hypothetical protein [Magnetococcales bacterium]